MVTPLWWPGTRGILGSIICQGHAPVTQEYSQTQSHMPYKLTAIHTPASRAMTIIHLWQHRNCKVQSIHWTHPGPSRTPYSLLPDSPVLGRRDSRCTWPTPPSGAPGRRQQHPWKSTCCSVPPLGKRNTQSDPAGSWLTHPAQPLSLGLEKAPLLSGPGFPSCWSRTVLYHLRLGEADYLTVPPVEVRPRSLPKASLHPTIPSSKAYDFRSLYFTILEPLF